LVTVSPPRTEKLAADPKPTDAVAPRALLATRRVVSAVSRKSPPASVLLRALTKGRRLTARESLGCDSYIFGTPEYMASPHCGVEHRD
jgi:hypothetical protein